MATAKATIYIGKTKLLPYHVHVEQQSDWHHVFEITVSTEKAEVMDGTSNASESVIIDNAMTYAGKLAEILIERPEGTFTFKGFVTGVKVEQTYAGDAFIILNGFSPTYILDGQEGVASFEEKTLKQIFNEVAKSFPQNIKKEVNPKYKDPILYVTRYKETQFQFLSRLANTYGEWFYYDGQQIVFGDLPAKKKKVKLNFGSDSMMSFNYGMSLRPVKFSQEFYSYNENKVLEESVSKYKPNWLDSHSSIAHKASKEFFAEEGIQPIKDSIKNDKQIKHIAETKKSATLSNVMIFNGQSADPDITIGVEVEVHSKKGFVGNYRVVAVTHNFNSNRDYTNLFQAIPVSSLIPPSNKQHEIPRAEAQVAEVVDNNDPDSFGRVRVKFKWQEGITPWIRVLTNHAGSDYGTYFIPEIGDEVFVDFEQGNPDRPYVAGSKYHSKTKPKWFDADNNLKTIKTRSGHSILFDDKDGAESITITDKKENKIVLNTKEESILISAPKKIEIKSEEIKLTGKNITINASSKLIEKGNNVTISAKSKLKMNGDMGAELVSNQKVDVSGKTGVKVASNVSTEIGGTASVKVQSSGITEVKGSLVKIN